MARWKSSFNMQPIARAVAVLLAAGMFSASTLPDSINRSNDGSGIPYRPSAFATGSNASRGGQKIRFTGGLSSNSDRNTEIPSPIEDRNFGSIRDQSCVNHRFVASNWPTSSENAQLLQAWERWQCADRPFPLAREHEPERQQEREYDSRRREHHELPRIPER